MPRATLMYGDLPIISSPAERRLSARLFDESIDMAEDHLRQPALTAEQRLRFETILDYALGWRRALVGRDYPKVDVLNLQE